MYNLLSHHTVHDPCLLRRAANMENIQAQYCLRRVTGGRGTADDDARHGRFAAACLLDWVINSATAQEVEEAYGAPQGLTKQGGGSCVCRAGNKR